MKEDLSGLATGIGSLPHKKVEDALDLIASSFPYMPHWPQLPQKDEKEGFVHQYLTPLVELGLISVEKQSPFFRTDAPDWLESLTKFYELYLSLEQGEDGLDFFAFPRASASGFYFFLEEGKARFDRAKFIKGQISGPVSLGFSVNDAQLRASFYDDELRAVLLKTLILHARWQVRQLQKFGLTPVIFFDEPGLYAYGQSTFVALSKEVIQESLRELINAIHEENGLVGAHCCAGVDWSLLFELPLDIVSFDAYNHFPSLLVYPQPLTNFLENDGYLAWGIVPTTEAAWQYGHRTLCSSLKEKIEKLVQQNVPRERHCRQILFTPSCGAGTLDIALSEHIYQLTASLNNNFSETLD